MLLDILLGLIAAHGVCAVFSVDPTAPYLLLGVVAALLPDVDFVWHWLRGREVAAHAGNPEDHRDVLHYPLVFVPAATAATNLAFGEVAGLIVGCALLLHFLHDSFGTGWGINWLWPLSKKSYKFFCEKDGTPSLRPVVSWSSHEKRHVMAQYGDPEWIQNLFLRPLMRGRVNLLIIAEVVFPVIALMAYTWWQLT